MYPSRQQKKAFPFQRLPAELRNKIYALVSAETVRIPFCPTTTTFDNMNIPGNPPTYIQRSSGHNLLFVSCQVHAEAIPHVYHTLRITADDPELCIASVRPDQLERYTRRVEISLACLCNARSGQSSSVRWAWFGGRRHRMTTNASNTSNYMNSLAGNGNWLAPPHLAMGNNNINWTPPLPAGPLTTTRPYPGAGRSLQAFEHAKGAWMRVLKRVSELWMVREFEVGFDVCCRGVEHAVPVKAKANAEDGDDGGEIVYSELGAAALEAMLGPRGYCVALERLFLRTFGVMLGSRFRPAERLVLHGQVPPSWLFRLMRPKVGVNWIMSVYSLSGVLAGYIQDREVELLDKLEKERLDELTSWALIEREPEPERTDVSAAALVVKEKKKTVFPATGALAVLVNASNGPSVPQWERNVGPGCHGVSLKETYPFMEVLKEKRQLKDLERSLDYRPFGWNHPHAAN